MTNNFDTGATYEFQLLHNIGFAYFKFIDFRLYDPNMLLINVFDFVSKTPIQNLDEIRDKDLLFGANCFVGTFPRKQKLFGIKYLGKSIHPFDNFVPDLAKKKSFELKKMGYDPYKSKWCPVVMFESKQECSFDVVKDLEPYHLVSFFDIQTRATMEIYRKREVNIEQVFDISNPDIFSHYFNTITKTEYSKIPLNKRGVAIGYESYNRKLF